MYIFIFKENSPMNARFHIPDFYVHAQLNLDLIDMIHDHPEYFRDGIEIASCYGCFAPALWNGGRAISGLSNGNRIENTIREFNERGVPIRYTFTNPTLTPADLRDPFCNRICRAAHNGFNEVIVNLPFLEEYIREKYPQYPLVSSTVKQLEDLDALIAELNKDYKLVVLDYNWNNDFEKLAKIPQEYRARCEILINPYCTPHCKRRADHYVALGQAQRDSATAPLTSKIQRRNTLKKAYEFKCDNTMMNFYEIQKFSTFVGNEQLEKYLEMGFNNFKIEGRVLHQANVLESYIYYMVKPEYRDWVRIKLNTSRARRPLDMPRMTPHPASAGEGSATAGDSEVN